MNTRITADIDNTPLSVVKMRTIAIINYLHDKFNIEIDRKEIRKSSRGKGAHVILFTQQKLKKHVLFLARFLLGDDHKRIKMDLKRRRPKQYLFKKKISLR